MDLLLDEEQEAIASSARSLLDALDHPARANALAEAGLATDEHLWARAVEQGWLVLGVPEADGGVGLGPPEQAVLARELGRGLAVGPFLSAMVAGALPDPAVREVLVDGGRVATDLGSPDATGASLVLDGQHADLVLRLGPDGVEVREVVADGTPVAGLDPTTGLCRLAVDAGPVLAVGGPQVAHLAAVVTASALTGIAEAVRDQAVRQATTREQFGRPIGSFQAIKHTCADLAVRAEAAWRQTCWAALTLHDGHADAGQQAGAARQVAEAAALEGAAANIQVHGAMGFTAEHTAHLYLKRARTWSLVSAARR